MTSIRLTKDLFKGLHQLINIVCLKLGLMPDFAIQIVDDNIYITINKSTGEAIKYTVPYDDNGLWKTEISIILNTLKKE